MAEQDARGQGSPRRKTTSPQRHRHRNTADETSIIDRGPAVAQGSASLTEDSLSKASTSSAASFESTRMNLRRHRRNTDHLYYVANKKDAVEPPRKRRKANAKKPKTAKRLTADKEVARNTDHLYNVATDAPDKLKKAQKAKLNNRDTDHMYNIRGSAAIPALSSASSSGDTGVTVGSGVVLSPADYRAMNKDHMYQHNTWKAQNKTKGKATGKRKCVRAVSDKQAGPQIQTRHASENDNENLSQQKCPSDKTTGQEAKRDIHEDKIPYDHDYLTVYPPCKEVAADTKVADTNVTAAAAVQESSPTHSDFSDHLCDDSRRAGSFHCDHMYFHSEHLDHLVSGKQPQRMSCFQFLGRSMQEHSYANLESYDACPTCSELVKQLIMTIVQQKHQIKDLKEQLEAVTARNRDLSVSVSAGSGNSASSSGTDNDQAG